MSVVLATQIFFYVFWNLKLNTERHFYCKNILLYFIIFGNTELYINMGKCNQPCESCNGFILVVWMFWYLTFWFQQSMKLTETEGPNWTLLTFAPALYQNQIHHLFPSSSHPYDCFPIVKLGSSWTDSLRSLIFPV